MADSNSNIDKLAQAQANKEDTINAFFDAASQAATYGRRASTCTGLTWGYYGGNIIPDSGTITAIANGTVSLTASAINYVVAKISDGVVSASTSTTNWQDSGAYWRLYAITTDGSNVLSWVDWRAGPFVSLVATGGVIATSGTEVDLQEQAIAKTRKPMECVTPSTATTLARMTWSPTFGKFYAPRTTAGANNLLTSVDGTKWVHEQTLQLGAGCYSVVDMAPTRARVGVVHLAQTNGFQYTDDGTTWNQANMPAATSWRTVKYSPSLDTLVAVGNDASTRSAYSTDGGATWTAGNIDNTRTWYALEWSADLGLFVAMSYDNYVTTSSDGINWTTATLTGVTNGTLWRELAWSPDLLLFVAVAQDGTTSPSAKILTSPDGTTWTQRAQPVAGDGWNAVTWCGSLGMFVASGMTGNTWDLLWSTDGITWTGIANPNSPGGFFPGIAWSEELKGAAICEFQSPTATQRDCFFWMGFAGSYTPQITHVANVSASTPYEGHWSRKGRTVTFGVQIAIDPTSAATGTLARFTVPQASNFGGTNECSGAWCSHDAADYSAIQSQAATDDALIQFTASTSSNRVGSLHCVYRMVG